MPAEKCSIEAISFGNGLILLLPRNKLHKSQPSSKRLIRLGPTSCLKWIPEIHNLVQDSNPSEPIRALTTRQQADNFNDVLVYFIKLILGAPTRGASSEILWLMPICIREKFHRSNYKFTFFGNGWYCFAETYLINHSYLQSGKKKEKIIGQNHIHVFFADSLTFNS